MHAPVRIWLELAHHEAFRVGGWAYVRVEADAVVGSAGGERRIGLEQTALAAAAAALRHVAPGAAVELRTSSALLLSLPGRIDAAEAEAGASAEDLARWASVAKALRQIRLAASRADLAPNTGGAFAAAWAEFARDRAKNQGAFTAAIPKANLLKAGV